MGRLLLSVNLKTSLMGWVSQGSAWCPWGVAVQVRMLLPDPMAWAAHSAFVLIPVVTDCPSGP